MKIYDSPRNLVLLVNATSEEEAAIGEELGIMGCRKPGLRIVGHETASKVRYAFCFFKISASNVLTGKICIDRVA